MEYTAILSDWLQVPTMSGVYVLGKIYEDKKKRFKDGTLIYTSLVLKNYYVEIDGKQETIIKTLNSTYLLQGVGANDVV